MKIRKLKYLFTLWLMRRKQENYASRLKDLCLQFQVDERKGSIFILCNGVAVKQISPDSSAKDIGDAISDMRDAAIDYYSSDPIKYI